MYEFLSLSKAHSNKGDKLQLKNVVFHTAKEIVGAKMNAKLESKRSE